MAVTAGSFLETFPEFSGVSEAPQISFWIKFAEYMLNASVWGDSAPAGQDLEMRDYGVLFFVAHNLSLSAMAAKSGANGRGIPGLSTGITSSKSVDKVSVSYDTGSTMEAEAGHWNMTTYGQRFSRMLKMVGSMPILVGAGSTRGSSFAWPGPVPFLGYTGM